MIVAYRGNSSNCESPWKVPVITDHRIFLIFWIGYFVILIKKNLKVFFLSFTSSLSIHVLCSGNDKHGDMHGSSREKGIE